MNEDIDLNLLAQQVLQILQSGGFSLEELSQASSTIGLKLAPVIKLENGTPTAYQIDISLLRGDKGDSGKSIELQKSAETLQWRVKGESEWNDLILLSDLKGEHGDPGKRIEMGISSTHIQWRPLGDMSWNDLIAISMLKGDQGDPLTWGDLTAEQKADLKGEPGDPLTFEDLTEEQKASLKGERGKPLVVLPNGNYGNWNEGTNQYEDSGVSASASVDLEDIEVTFTTAMQRELPVNGEKFPVAFGKVVRYLSDLGNLAYKNSLTWQELTGKPDFSPVATTGSYLDLADKPTIPSPIDVVDNLDSDSSVNALSAKQGKELKSQIDSKTISKKFTYPVVNVSDWQAIAGNLFEAKIMDEDVFPGKFVEMWPSNSNVDVALEAEILPSLYIFEGYFTVRCRILPTSVINFRCLII